MEDYKLLVRKRLLVRKENLYPAMVGIITAITEDEFTSDTEKLQCIEDVLEVGEEIRKPVK